ncbi:cupin domain-containing protein [Salinactinospora qingdaonensis]|uniref:Cupin type-2 domain-containing protein n=1 Tax=Salinactinospora qingdaonensis TaxID=702744 RepID=A0ABP7FWI7_9ACTN
MSHISFPEKDAGNMVASHYSTGQGQVLRSDKIEITKIRFQKGHGAATHHHPEEQVFYILEGCLEVTVDGETYEVHPGEGSFHPSNAPHSVMAKEDTVALSFKNLVDPNYEATGNLT